MTRIRVLIGQVIEYCTESFIVRVYRERNRHGFVKAFSEDAENLQTGFGRVERTMRLLYVKRLYLWPRFQATVADALDRFQPEVRRRALLF